MKRKILKTMLYVVTIIVMIFTVVIIALWVKSPGVTEPITDADGKVVEGSIAEIEKITLLLLFPALQPFPFYFLNFSMLF